MKVTVARSVAPAKVSAPKKVAGALLSATAAVLFMVQPANAGLVEDLVAKSTENKALNDKKRIATSNANFARSRTVADGSCNFPSNFLGCNIASQYGEVKYLTDDLKIECQGKEGKCASYSKGMLPPFMGV